MFVTGLNDLNESDFAMPKSIVAVLEAVRSVSQYIVIYDTVFYVATPVLWVSMVI